jgi:hypothetical protein
MAQSTRDAAGWTLAWEYCAFRSARREGEGYSREKSTVTNFVMWGHGRFEDYTMGAFSPDPPSNST